MHIDQKNIHQEIQKRSSHKFVQQNYDDIYQQTYLVLLEGEIDYEKAVERAIFQTKRAITNPKLKNHKFVSIDSVGDIQEKEDKPLEIVVRPLTRSQKKHVYKKIKNLTQLAIILEKLGIKTYKLKSSDGKYLEGLQVYNMACPICGQTEKTCFSIYRTEENKKVRISYSCHKIKKGEHYDKYPNNLDGIFMSLLGLSKIRARKVVFKIILSLIK